MILAGLKINSSPLINYKADTNSWENLLVSAVYPSADGQNYVDNPITKNDIAIDTVGHVWKVLSVSHTTGNNFTIEVTLVNGPVNAEIIPNIGDTKAAISTPKNNQLSAHWDATYVDANIQKIIAIFNTESPLKLDDVMDVEATIVHDKQLLVFDSSSNTWVAKTIIGSTNGIASLDDNGKVLLSQLPDSLLGAMIPKGARDMSVPLPTAASDNAGWYYITSVAGNGYNVKDWAVSNGTTWERIDNTDSIVSVNSKTGEVVLNKSDIGLSNVTNDKQLLATQTLTLTGDVTATSTALSTGSLAVSLTPTGVTAGTYNTASTITPLRINAKGQITAADAAVDIAPKFTSITNKPTTLSGYGITDAVSLTNGKIPTNLLGTGTASAHTHLNGNQEWVPGVMIYKVVCTDWASSNFTLPTGWTATKVNSDTAIQLTHNLGAYPVNWSGIQTNTTPKLAILPSAVRNLQIDSDNQVTILQIGSLVNFIIYLTFN